VRDLLDVMPPAVEATAIRDVSRSTSAENGATQSIAEPSSI
jgi:hypothetical protein